MLIPSGILCIEIAIVIDIPSFIFLLVVINVAIPSGKLCIIIPIIVIIPSLYSDFSSKLFGKNLSIIIDITIPNDKNIKVSKRLKKGLKEDFKNLTLSGSKSKSDIKSITEEAKAIPLTKKFKLFFLDKKIVNAPINVERPASPDNKKAKFVFTLSP